MAFMDKFNVVKDTVTSKSKEVAQKAKDMADIASLNSQIKAQNDAIKKAYEEIGKIVFEAEQDNPDSQFQKQCASVLRSQAQIIEIEKEIAQIKGVKKCPNCGSDIPLDNTHCGHCGSEYVEPEVPEVEKVCPSCGEPVAEGDTMCVKCGRNL